MMFRESFTTTASKYAWNFWACVMCHGEASVCCNIAWAFNVGNTCTCDAHVIDWWMQHCKECDFMLIDLYFIQTFWYNNLSLTWQIFKLHCKRLIIIYSRIAVLAVKPLSWLFIGCHSANRPQHTGPRLTFIPTCTSKFMHPCIL